MELEIPSTHKKSIKTKDDHIRVLWKEAQIDHLNTLNDMETYHLIERPKNAHILRGRWVFDTKVDGVNPKLVKKLRARFCAKGFTQKEGVDFYETFSPTAKLKTLKILLTILASNGNMVSEQWDVSAAYLHADLDCNIYMEQPEGFEIEGKENYVIKLDKALFGLKQSGRL